MNHRAVILPRPRACRVAGYFGVSVVPGNSRGNE
jgi:hypothetical protein